MHNAVLSVAKSDRVPIQWYSVRVVLTSCRNYWRSILPPSHDHLMFYLMPHVHTHTHTTHTHSLHWILTSWKVQKRWISTHEAWKTLWIPLDSPCTRQNWDKGAMRNFLSCSNSMREHCKTWASRTPTENYFWNMCARPSKPLLPFSLHFYLSLHLFFVCCCSTYYVYILCVSVVHVIIMMLYMHMCVHVLLFLLHFVFFLWNYYDSLFLWPWQN